MMWPAGTSAGALSTVVPTKCAKRGHLNIEFQMAAKPQDHVCGQMSLKAHSHFYLLFKDLCILENMRTIRADDT